MFARARYKYPVEGRDYSSQTKPCPLDLSGVPMSLPPIPQDRPGLVSRFKGVTKNGKKWQAQIRIPSEGGKAFLGSFDSEEEAGIMFARARYKYPGRDRVRPQGQVRAAKATESASQQAESVTTFRGTPQRVPEELDEVDGILISAASTGPTAAKTRVGPSSWKRQRLS